MAGLVGVLRNGRGLGTGESYIPVVLFDPLLHRSPCFTDVDFAALAGNPVDHAILFSLRGIKQKKSQYYSSLNLNVISFVLLP